MFRKDILFPFVGFFIISLLLMAQTGRGQPEPKREFRGAWIATVENVDWPSRPGFNSGQQQQEFIRLLDTLQAAGINAVLVQIRPAADAFYNSRYEPWSSWLSGKQGLPPVPYYDPLAFMIGEAHKRGMEFHAWFNPYRAVANIHGSVLSPVHISKIHPDWFINYGDKKYFNPGLPQNWAWLVKIVSDVVRRYDIDAVHFDDYFYPYRIAGKQFPDYNTWKISGAGRSLEDWRRHNIDTMIRMVGSAIKEIKPWVKFGISPFGVWRNLERDPEGSDTHGGQTDYDDLYADVVLWLKNGWIDYVAPQLYWEFGNRSASYEVLLDWWARHCYGRALYIGHAIYRIGAGFAWRNPDQLGRQIRAARTYTEVGGSVFYSAKYFLSDPLGFTDTLKRNYYRFPALVPPMPWIDSVAPPPPLITRYTIDSAGVTLTWIEPDTASRTAAFVIYRSSASDPAMTGDPSNILAILTEPTPHVFTDRSYHPGDSAVYVITALDRLHNESASANAVRISGQAIR
jgi:uncharacterized lipoprotein YddW (UPF0748 family)